ncbi:MAG: NAD(P)/FAD-dependent oxidoreductase [Ferruginibacter sp.]
MIKPSIIIIGAGATGLIAAKELSPDFEVIVLEAQTRTGGRLHSVLHQENIIEAGAEFVHGDLPVTLGLLKEAGIAYVKIRGEMYRKKNGLLAKVEEMTEGWNGLLRKMNGLKDDITMREFLDKYYPGPANELLRSHVKSYAEGFDLADINNASVKALHREWNTEEHDNYRIRNGYGALSQYLQQQAENGGAIIYTGKLIKEVQWQQGKVNVRAANGEKYTAEKLLVTVPVSVLQQPASKAYIHFTPAIHFNENVAADIGFGTVIKVILKFKNPFWQNDAGFILSNELFPTWWTQLPDKVPILTGWLGGPGAEALSNETDAVIEQKALASVAAIFDRPVAELIKELNMAMVFNWKKNEYAMGAYSYATIHSGAAIDIITAPLAGTIFFAGEALYTGDHPGTVEAALVNGINTSLAIKNAPLYF